MSTATRSWATRDEQATRAVAAQFAAVLGATPAAPADLSAAQTQSAATACARRIYLSGELGAGKTTWVRGFLAAAGVSTPVQSPSYALLATYEARGRTYVHLDCYRLNKSSDLAALALDDYDRADALWLVEWPEQVSAALPPPDLWLTLSLGSTGHSIHAETRSDLGREWLSLIRD